MVPIIIVRLVNVSHLFIHIIYIQKLFLFSALLKLLLEQQLLLSYHRVTPEIKSVAGVILLQGNLFFGSTVLV